jgi:hypothetical protein
MKWKRNNSVKMEPGKRLLIYSPVYEEKDNDSMLYRIIDSQFLHITQEALWYCELEPPYKKKR